MTARRLYVSEPPSHYRARLPIVVDSSTLCAVLFDEAERVEAEQQLAGKQLFAPNLLSHEVVNVALNKLQRGVPAQAVNQALADFDAHGIEMTEIDPKTQFALAQHYGLSAYDAAYLCLAAELKIPLATFDRKLAAAAAKHLGSLDEPSVG